MQPLQLFYFSEFEHRAPPLYPALPRRVEMAWQIMAGLTVGLGLWYLGWRWSGSLNPDAMWFAIPVALAETAAFLGTLLFFNDVWAAGDTPRQAPPATRGQAGLTGDGPIMVDLMITTYDEDPELVRYSLRDAAQVISPENTQISIHVLDDGDRAEMAAVTAEEGANYHRRTTNRGYKAGNLRNALLQSGGDFVVICDADTRLFPSFVKHTLGYFRDPDVAWVQTPHWFYDIPEGSVQRGRGAQMITRTIGRHRTGTDPFLSDPGLFFDVIQRRRNRNGASFCCGAASIHRREAVFQNALTRWQNDTARSAAGQCAPGVACAQQATELTPFLYHVSEDILTSIHLHSQRTRRWRSVYHPEVEAKMLSPWGITPWAAQKLKYAGGTFDIAFRHNLLFRAGMPWRTKLHYAATFWSYLASFGLLVLLIAPAITLFTGVAPVAAYSTAFFAHLLPLLVANEIALMLGCWGHDARRGALLPIASLGINLRAFWLAFRGGRIAFKPTPKLPGIDPSLRYVALPVVLFVLNGAGILWALGAAGLGLGLHSTAMLIANLFWAGWNITTLYVPIRAALWRPATNLVGGSDDHAPS